jgi:hypothetical protein
MIRVRLLIFLTLLWAPATVAAQSSEPIGLFAADVRVPLPKFKQAASVATALGVDPLDLPTRGFGLVFGAHLYPARKGVVTLGIGGELMTSRRGRTQQVAAGSKTTALTVHTRFSSISPQISLNFGSKQGWSYISGGLGWGGFTTELETKPLPDAEGRLKTINYGGGARWFLNQHVAVSLDLRFYAVNPQEASLGRPAFPRMTIMAFSAGIGLK